MITTLCTLVSILISVHTVWSHLKNYRKPLDQRLVIRILLLVPLFSLSSYLNLHYNYTFIANFFTFLCEIYEAFVIYTFYSLLTNLLGGERAIIISKTGDPPVRFLWGVIKIDISNPRTFWKIKWLIMQYVSVRLIVVLLSSLISNRVVNILLVVLYNVSITLALNALMAFWVCLKSELEPYRVVMKFLSVKMIVFFSYWQVLALQILAWLGLFDQNKLSVYGNTLMCVECVLFAAVHFVAFPASDYEATFLFGFARVRLWYALRDVFGINDLVHDFKSTFLYPHYSPRDFDSVEYVLDHPQSHTRQMRIKAGLRYQNGGSSKYWLPNKSLLPPPSTNVNYGSTLETSLPDDIDTPIDDEYSEGEEHLYTLARETLGDYNYPVLVVQETEEYVSFEERMRRQQIMSS